MKSPFKFLDPYQLEDKDAFFGREAETKELYNLVTKNRLTFVYGPSGTGKTSLVQCGLAGRFGGVDWLPIFVRRGDDINAALLRETGKALGEGPGFDGDIPAAVGALFNRYLRPVYLIFDQFEELFILGNAAEQQIFYDTIAELLEAELPCRILFILREDYFGHLNQFEKTVPELYHRKLRVEPMSRDNLRAVITGSCKVFNIGFDDARRSPELIMDNIMADKSGIHMPYVQVYLHMLYQEATKSLKFDSSKFEVQKFEVAQGVRFTDAVIRTVGPITDVLGRFLQEQKTLIFKNLQQDTAFAELPEDAVSQVLDVFVSKEGTKVPVGYTLASDGRPALSGEAARVLAVLPPALVSATLLELEKSRILRRSDDTLELAHDTLAALIDQQRSAELRQLRDIRQRIEAGWREHVDSLQSDHPYYFDKGQLARIEPFLTKLALEPEQADFLKKSRVEAERLENAEKERVARELQLAEEKLAAEQQAREREQQLAEEKLAAEERARKRQQFFTRVVAGVAVLAFGASLFAGWQYKLAQGEKKSAIVARDSAQIATLTALHSDSIARGAEKRALNALDSVQVATLAALRSDSLARLALLKANGNAQIAVRTLLTVAEKAIKQLNYPEASEAVNAAVRLEANKPEVADALLEMAFFHNHTGDWKTAAKETATAARWLGKPDIAAQAERVGAGNALRALRRLQETLSLARLKELEHRYFPEMVDIKGGTFISGCVKPRDRFLCGRYNKDSLYRATLSDYQLARTETTVLQYNLYAVAMGRNIAQRITVSNTLRESNPTWGWIYNHPVVDVTWYDAVEYANWASEQQGFTPVYTILKAVRDTSNQNINDDFQWTVTVNDKSDGYRLPTEAEWEFAARGGIRQDPFEYTGSDDLDEVAWSRNLSGGRTQPVGGKKPNSLQLYDLSGNVWEWCWDWYGDYPQKPETDYRGLPSGQDRAVRGGSWLSTGDTEYRPEYRYSFNPEHQYYDYGFRVARH